ncbi:hypothetical protein F4823DRAFT_633497 [Ustulina deusta]|nr:hypothetical protein F4823DRAFT_633497 [Ustulina deusta]
MCASTSSPVSSTMTFIEPWDQETKGRPFFRSAAAPGMETINFKWVENEVSISNARPLRDDFGLDQNGFAYMDDEDGLDGEVLQALRCGDKEEVKRLYYPRIESLVKRATGGQRVITFDHTMRKRDPARDKRDNTDGHEQPATTVWHHALYLFPIALTQSSADQIEDRSGKGALRRLREKLGPEDDYDDITTKRVQIINVWRPLNGPALDWPLAQMDFTTVDPAHVHPCDLWRGEYEERGQTVTVEYSPKQRWWYLHGHRCDEVTLLKIWDSWGDRGIADCQSSSPI